MIKKKEVVGMIRGVLVSRQAPSISHLFFSDNYIIFCKATMEKCKHVATMLDVYGKESGQKLNRGETSLFFSKNMKEDI